MTRMIQSVAQPEINRELSMRDLYLEGFRWMLLARVLDDKLASLYRGGKIHGGVFLGRGQEALSVAIGLALKPGDVFAPLVRDLAGRLAFGETVLDVVRTFMGSVQGPMRARDGNVHRGRPREGMLPMISHLGAMVAVVNGMLLARRMKGESGSVGVSCLGDGATSTGSFHEALNQAAIEGLPLVLVVANNCYAYSTPNARQFACRDLVDRAAGYGVAGHSVDGTDLAECVQVVFEAVRRAREGGGPQLVVAQLLRLCGHGEHDDASYVAAHMKESVAGRDCLRVAEERILLESWAERGVLDGWRMEQVKHVEEVVAKVQREPGPDPFKEDWLTLASPHLVGMHASEKNA
jgi:pyruvate dehydrogenase E1 component alpha subunit/2-oxoisovalerate dehydrogenase E1 component alpha subunit